MTNYFIVNSNDNYATLGDSTTYHVLKDAKLISKCGAKVDTRTPNYYTPFRLDICKFCVPEQPTKERFNMGKKSFRSMYLSSQREVEALKKKISALEVVEAENINLRKLLLKCNNGKYIIESNLQLLLRRYAQTNGR